jgi:DNA replication and repair protein RecF
MHISHFSAARFRNLERATLEPCPGVNVIYGENGQGKTNLVEAIWLFTGCRSFRTAETADLVRQGTADAMLRIAFESNAREQRAELYIQKRRELRLNGFAEETPRRMLGVFPAVAFTPATLALAQGGPGERRRFLDVALCMLRPVYAVHLAKYLKALAQRNALLRRPVPEGANAIEALLLPWEEALAREAAAISIARRQYLQALLPHAGAFYAGISGGREVLAPAYQPHGLLPEEWNEASPEALTEAYRAALAQSRRADLRRQMTGLGPHRDDLYLQLDGMRLRAFGSQGQQRSAALALKLAEAAVLREQTAECPVALLDDVLSELDAGRQRDLLRYLDGWQVFLTCCEPGHLLHAQCGKIFEVKQGNIDEQT